MRNWHRRSVSLTVSEQRRVLFHEVDRLLELEERRAVRVAEARLIAARGVLVWVPAVVLLLADVVHDPKAYCCHRVEERQLFLRWERAQSIDHPVIHEVRRRGFDDVSAPANTHAMSGKKPSTTTHAADE